jgi:hypothetical protein
LATDAAAAASALSDLDTGLSAALAFATATSDAAGILPQVRADATAAAGMPTPFMETADKNAACGLITTAEASALLGGTAETQPFPGTATTRTCIFSFIQHQGTLDKAALIKVEYHPTDGANWYVEDHQRLSLGSYRSGSDIGDQWFALNAQQIWILKGNVAVDIIMPVFTDMTGTPTEEMKALASKVAGRMP